MIFNGMLGSWECIATIACITIIPLLLTLPTFSAEVFGTASLLQILYITSIVGIIFFAMFKMFRKFKQKDLIDIAEIVGGKFLKYLIGFSIIIYLFFESFIALTDFTINVQNTLFHETPYEYIALLFIFTVLIGSLIGIRGIFRVGAIICPILIIAFSALFLSLTPSVDLTNFTPIFGNGIGTFFTQGTFHITCFNGIALLLLLAPNVKHLEKTAFHSFVLTLFLIFVTYFLVFGLIPYPSVTDNYVPIFELIKLISYGRFIQRVESIYILTWLPATFMYLSCGIVFIANILKKLFSITDTKRIIPALCIAVLSASLMLSTYVELLTLRKFVSTYITPIVIVVVPFIILFIANKKQSKT